MSTRNALLAAIIANPEVDLPRLVYADYLDETGDTHDAARATLIRAQIEAVRLPLGDPVREELERDARELWETHKAKWFDGINTDRLPSPYRGFIDSLSCLSEEAFDDETPLLLAREPISDITLSGTMSGALARVAEWASLSQIRKLEIGMEEEAGDPELLPLLLSPHLTGLHSLWIQGSGTGRGTEMPESVRLLSTQPRFSSLKRFKLEKIEIGNAGANALANSAILRGLTELGLRDCGIGSDGLRGILASSLVSGVTQLLLSGNASTPAEGESLAQALAAANLPDQLAALELEDTAFNDRAATTFGRRAWPVLRHLAIRPQYQLPEAEERLRTLTARGVESLFAAGEMPNLETLQLSWHPIGDAGAEALARGNRLPRIKQLILMRTGITATGLRPLVAAYSTQLTTLRLEECLLGDAGAAVIARASWPSMVPGFTGRIPYWNADSYWPHGIFLSDCGIGAEGAKALAISTSIPSNIPELHFGMVTFSDELEALFKERHPNTTIHY